MTSRYVLSLCLLFLFLFTNHVNAAAPTRYVFESVSAIHPATLVEYASDGVWIVETYSEARNALPLKTGRWVFPEKSQADRFLQSMSTVWILQPQAAGVPTPQFRTELMTQAVWDAPNEWDWNWEIKFAAWVRANITSTFFSEHNVATDCADVAIAARWIFARIYGLPAGQTIGGSGNVLFTNESFKAEWAGLKRDADWEKDQVFRKSLDYVLNHSYTHTLFQDSYPIAIDAASFLEGTYHLAVHTDMGHTQLIMQVNPSSTSVLPLYAVASTIPREVRDLHMYPFFDSEQPEKGSAGFLKMRWPIKRNGRWSLVSKTQMPNFSEEQYEAEFMKGTDNFGLAVFKRINPAFDPLLKVKESEITLEQLIQDRVRIVEDGFAYCSAHNCSPGTGNYENWSTPSRDKRLGAFIADTESYVSEISNYYPDARTEWDAFRAKKMLSLGQYDYLASSIQLVWGLNLYDSNPEVSIEERWTLSPAVFAQKTGAAIKKSMLVRESRLAANSCVANPACTPDSMVYKQNQTFEIDQELYRWATSILLYCPNNTSSICPAFQSETAKVKITAGSHVIALDKMPEYSVWLNSDPRVANDIRQGSYGLTMPTRVFHGEIGSIEESTNGYVFIRANGRVALLDAGLRDVWSMNGDSSSAFNLETAELASYSSGVLTLKEPGGRETSQMIPLNESPALRWVSPKILLAVISEPEMIAYLFRLETNGSSKSLILIDTVKNFDPLYETLFNDGRGSSLFNFKTKSTSGDVAAHYYNLANGQRVDATILPADVVKESFVAHIEVGGRVLASYTTKSNQYNFGWLRLSDGQFQHLGIQPSQIRFIRDDVLLVQTSAAGNVVAEVIVLKGDGSLDSRTVVGTSISEGKIHNGYFSVMNNDQDRISHFISAGNVQHFGIPEEFSIGDDPGPFVVLYGGTGIEIFVQSTGQQIFSGKFVLSLDSANGSLPYALFMPVINEPWLHYGQIGETDLPLVTASIAVGNWMGAVSDNHIGRFRSIGNMGTGTTSLFRKY